MPDRPYVHRLHGAMMYVRYLLPTNPRKELSMLPDDLVAALKADSKTDGVAANNADSIRYFVGKLICECDPSDVAHDIDAGNRDVVVVDSRSPESYAEAHIPGAINLHHGSFTTDQIKDLDQTRLYVTYGSGPDCNAGTKGAARLAMEGFRVKEMIGGFEYWKRDGLPVTS